MIVQDAPNGQTHYIVVPNSWAVSARRRPRGATRKRAARKGRHHHALEEIQKTARIFGANVITERLLDAFLDY